MQPTPRYLALAALALAACGDGASADPVAAAHPTDAPETAARGRAAVPAEVRMAPPQTEALRLALAGLLQADDYVRDLALRKQARRAVVAAGPAGLAAMLEWIESDDERQADEAAEVLPDFGLDGFRGIADLLTRVGPGREPGAALAMLDVHRDLWSRSDAAGTIARAAWAHCVRPSGTPERIVLGIVTAAGDLATDLAPEIVRRCRGPAGNEWLEALAHESRVARAAAMLHESAADLVEFLRSGDESARSAAGALLAAMRDPPRAAVDAALRDAAAGTGGAAAACARIAAIWGDEDVRCAAAARGLLASADELTRTAVLDGWAAARSMAPDDFVAGARLVADPVESTSAAARRLAASRHATAPGTADAWSRALGAADGAGAIALCRGLEDFCSGRPRDATEPVFDALVPALLRHAANPDPIVAAAALRALSGATRDHQADAASLGATRLGDGDPRVRAWAASYADLDPAVADARIAEVARQLVESLPPSRERGVAFDTLLRTDPAAARTLACNLLDDADDDLRARAEDVIAVGPPVGAPSAGAIDSLVRRLDDETGRERAFRVLLRIEGGRDAALAWLSERLAAEPLWAELDLLRLVICTGGIARDAVPVFVRAGEFGENPQFDGICEVALAAMEPDDEAALRRLTLAILAAPWPAAEFALDRLTRLGPQGASLIVRRLSPARTRDDGRWLVATQHGAVVAEATVLAASPDASDRACGAMWAAVLPRDDAIPILRALVDDTSDGVRRRALVATMQVAEQGLDGRGELVDWCVRALRELRSLRRIDPGADRTTYGWPVRRAAAILARAPSLSEGGVAALRVAMDAPDAEVRFLAAMALVLHGVKEDRAVGEVHDGLAALASGDIPRLRADHGDPQDKERVEYAPLAARTIVRLGQESASLAGVLSLVITSEEVADRTEILDAVARIGPAAAGCVPALRSVVHDATLRGDGGDVPNAAIRALGTIGPAAMEALPELRAAARVAGLREAAAAALRAIETSR